MQNVQMQHTAPMPDLSKADMQPVTYSAYEGKAEPIPELPDSSDEEFSKEEPAKEEAAGEEFAKAEPAKEEAAKEESVKEESVKEELSKEEISTEETSKEDIPKEETPKAEIVDEEPVPAEPAKEEPAAQEPIAQEPIAQEPIVQEPIVQEPIAQKPAAQGPIAQEPFIQQNFTGGISGNVYESEPSGLYTRETMELPRFDELYEQPGFDQTSIYDRTVYKAPPILNNQKPVARTSAPIMLDPEKADVLEWANNKNDSKPEKGRSMGRGLSKPAKAPKAPKAQKAPKLQWPVKRGMMQPSRQINEPRNQQQNQMSAGQPNIQQNLQQAGPITYNSSPAQVNMPAAQQNTFMGNVQTTTQVTPDNLNGTASPSQTGVQSKPAPNRTAERRTDRRGAGNPDQRASRRNQDGSIKREEQGRRATDSLIFGIIPRSTMSLIFLIALIVVSFIFALMLTDVKVPVLIIIILVEVIMGVFLSHSPSFIAILLAAALTLAGALTEFFIPVCIGNAIMLSANLVMKGE